MEESKFTIIRTISSTIMNENADLDYIYTTYQHICEIDYDQCTALLAIVDQQAELQPQAFQNRSGFIDMIRRILLDYQSQLNPYDANNFLAYIRQKNYNRIGVAMLDHKGVYLLLDQKSRSILELRKSEEFTKTIFQQLCQHSLEKIKTSFQNILLENNKMQLEGYFTIYSQRNQKRSLSLLKGSFDNSRDKKSQRIRKQINKIHKEKEQGISKKSLLEQELYYKYLKTIKYKMMRADVIFTEQFVEMLSDELLVNKYVIDNISSYFPAVIVEFSDAEEPEFIPLESILQDEQIIKNECKQCNYHSLMAKEVIGQRQSRQQRQFLLKLIYQFMISIQIDHKTGQSERQLLEYVIKQNGWQQAPPYNIYWNCKNIQNQGIINKISGMINLCCKSTTTLCFRAFQAFYPEEFDFYPKSLIVPQELNKFNNNGKWIAKPSNGSQGKGIFLVKDKNDLILKLRHTENDMLVQEYIEPLLLDGKKFDLRVYVLISSTDPLICFMNEEGLVRFCSETYNNNTVYGQFTNFSLNQNHHQFIYPIEIADENSNKRAFSILRKQLQQNGIDSQQIFDKVQKVTALTIKAIYPFLAQKATNNQGFQILGLDILIDKQLKPWLLEINALPSLSITSNKEISQLDLHVKSRVIQDAIKIKLNIPQTSYTNLSEMYQLQTNMITDLLRPYKFCNNNQLLNCSQFCKLCLFPGMCTNKISKADYEIAFIRSLRFKETRLMDFFEFLDALQSLAKHFQMSLLDFSTMVNINF